MTATPASSATTLSEAASKEFLSAFGVPFPPEHLAADVDGAVAAASELGFPVAVKLNGDRIAHKTERGLVRLNLGSAEAVREAAEQLLAAARPEDGEVALLVAPMLSTVREFIAGVSVDASFGPTVLFGVGGVLAEAIDDVQIRLAPLDEVDAREAIAGIRTQDLLGDFRGQGAVDVDALVESLVALGRAAAEPGVVSIDCNPVLVDRGRPVAVDALVERSDDEAEDAEGVDRPARPDHDGFRALFEPRGVIVAGASTHPGKFGFVSLHNLLANGYQGQVAATNRDGATVLGIETVPSIDDVPDGPWDLIFVCTPAATNPDVLRQAAAKGVKAAFVTSAGYGEAGPDGLQAQHELLALADELGMLLAGPNGQGVVSTPAALCAQIVAPYPPAGRIGIASQSGNFVSSFMNWSRQSGVGVSRAVSAGNAAATTVPDYLDFYADDDATAVGLAYLEGIGDGRALFDSLRSSAARKPLVVVKGGATEGGAAAAASHTGSLAADDTVFDGAMAQAGVNRAATVEEAFEAAATFATQPLPRGPRTAVVTTAGGWGVVTADAITSSTLELAALPADLEATIDTKLPPRWSRNNPIDLAGGETRDTIPEVLEAVAAHPEIDAVIFLGLGVQSNQAAMMEGGPFHPDWGLDRIVAYHQRQDARFARAAAEISEATGKPILVATELAVADPANPGPAEVRATGRYCYPSGNRAVTALEHLWRRRRFLDARGR